MLIEFRVKNFKSFRDEQVFSMVASSDTALPDNTIAVPAFSKKLVRSAALYGANASGKSNFVAALSFVAGFVRDSARRTPGSPIEVQAFRLDSTSREAPTEFEVSFIHSDVRYQYGFVLDTQRVHREWLIAYPQGQPQTWFERTTEVESDKTAWYFGSKLMGEKKKLQLLTRTDVLFLSVAATFNHRQLSQVYTWFSQYLGVIHTNLAQVHLEQFVANRVKEDSTFHAHVKDLLRLADLGITDFSAEEKEITKDEPAHIPDVLRLFALTVKAVYVDIQMEHATKEQPEAGIFFSIDDESHGTRRLFALGGAWLQSLQEGFILVVDELDDSLHPMMVQALIRMFHNPEINQRNAQLIFNTHDTTLLDATLLRRDQIWFVEKDNGGASHLYALLDFSPRKDKALAKGYLQGRYGAIPFIGELMEGKTFRVKKS